MGAMMRSFDLSRTPLGPVTDWPASLRAATSICLNSRYPMFIAWGKHRSMIYNDAYTAVLAGKHPEALGRPAEQVWSEIWHILGPHWTRVFDQGEATWAEDLLLLMNRSGYDEETYFTFSYSPIRGEGGSVEGMFCACQETTEKVIGERRLKTLPGICYSKRQNRIFGQSERVSGPDSDRILGETFHACNFAST
jgi:hypothetical protein